MRMARFAGCYCCIVGGLGHAPLVVRKNETPGTPHPEGTVPLMLVAPTSSTFSAGMVPGFDHLHAAQRQWALGISRPLIPLISHAAAARISTLQVGCWK